MSDDETVPTADAAQYKALAHPLRQRILSVLDDREATAGQLARMLDTLKGNIAHHLGILERAGLVAVARTASVRGGTTRYYHRPQRNHHIPRATAEADPAGVASLMRGVADEMAATPAAPEFLGIRHVRLTREQLDRLREVLLHLAGPDDLPDAGPGHDRYGIALTVYPSPETEIPE
ncbi:helix-turn-helix protein [Stackebrandtia albiflava]|uniref:Helix-turn-helix protein n=1 Tax=Stackebrandtia albiflava TaxID=406432 RepID=A0A562V4Z5_9ACTN|nr:helix-turn-helix domain-containing protein [Stackebrandtia albiflava]TWJ12966.1 helix-turn-helix protein [Stackebrandtia albiflava]